MTPFSRMICRHRAIGNSIINANSRKHVVSGSLSPRYGSNNFFLNTCLIHSDIGSDNDGPSTQNPVSLKRLDVAIVGAPNAGKSQLLNCLIGEKVAAVSRKRHTTRTGILGARTFDDTQLVFIDTPGFLHFEKGHKEGVRKLLSEASSEMESADFVLLVVDAAKTIEEDLMRTLVTLMFLALRSKGRKEVVLNDKESPTVPDNDSLKRTLLANKFAVVLNKVDLVKPKDKLLIVAYEVGLLSDSCIRHLLQQIRSPTKAKLVDLINSVLANYESQSGFDGIHEDDQEIFAALAPEFFFTSAITKDDEGVDDVLGLLLERATPSQQWIVDKGQTSGMSHLEQVEEIIREKIYRCLHREVPHSVRQQNRMFQPYQRTKQRDGDGDDHDSDFDDRSGLRIHQDLIVKTRSHQRLVLGSSGKTLERIRLTALSDLENRFGCEIDLVLHVRISKSSHDVPLDADAVGTIAHDLLKE